MSDQKEHNYILEDAMFTEENEMLLEELEGNEDEWREEPPLLGPGCQQMWNGKDCNPETVEQILNAESLSPNTVRFLETEADSSPVAEGTVPSSVDTITSHDSLNLILPSDAMKLQSKKSVNIHRLTRVMDLVPSVCAKLAVALCLST
ncbi:hypothetical protein O3P69_003079 [Scylla paramamosain]|uniref:Uncharacterized protein n=1 Tax=Scylla paramamosain TaxID=85552 RepID=A0AAW0UKB9_SCYPA